MDRTLDRPTERPTDRRRDRDRNDYEDYRRSTSPRGDTRERSRSPDTRRDFR